MQPPRSVLIVQTAFIGDVILATALVESLHQKFPQANLDFVTRMGNEELLEGHPFLRSVLVFDKRKKFKNLISLIHKVRSNRYDVVVNVQRFGTTGFLTALSGAKVTVGFDKNPFSFLFSKKVPHQIGQDHEVRRNDKLIEFMVGVAGDRPRLYPSSKQFEKVTPFQAKPYVTISPASVWFTKQFPAEKWIEFLDAVPGGIKVYLLGSKSDGLICESIIKGSSNKNVKPLAGELSLLESAALMKGAIMNYVNDSAPMHLASAMNAPVCAVYCSTVPSFGFGPLSDNSVVLETIEELTCRPCGLHGLRSCPLGHFRCAITIQKEQLLAAIVRTLPPI